MKFYFIKTSFPNTAQKNSFRLIYRNQLLFQFQKKYCFKDFVNIELDGIKLLFLILNYNGYLLMTVQDFTVLGIAKDAGN